MEEDICCHHCVEIPSSLSIDESGTEHAMPCFSSKVQTPPALAHE